MITTTATLTLLALTLVTLVMRGRSTKPPLVEVSFMTRYGLDTQGRVWSVRRLDRTSVRLYRGAHVHVDACGVRTLATLTDRYGISWER